MGAIEDGISQAFSNFNQTLMGSVLVVTFIASIFMFRFLNGIITELKSDLKAEREAHQKTRDKQIEDIRNLHPLATSVDGMRSSMMDIQTMMKEILLKRAGS